MEQRDIENQVMAELGVKQTKKLRFIDLDDSDFMHVFMNLKLEDLVNVIDSHPRFEKSSNDVFWKKYAKQQIRIYQDDNTEYTDEYGVNIPIEESAVCVQEKNMVKNHLHYFGHLFINVCIVGNKNNKLNEKGTGHLENHFTFVQILDFIRERKEQQNIPFPNIQNVTIEVDVSHELTEFLNSIPNIREFEFKLSNVKRPTCIEVAMPKMHTLTLYNKSSIYHNERHEHKQLFSMDNVKSALMLNRQIRSFSTSFFTDNNRKKGSSLGNFLQLIDLNLFRLTYFNLCIDDATDLRHARVLFDNLDSLVLLVCCKFSNYLFSFVQRIEKLLTLELTIPKMSSENQIHFFKLCRLPLLSNIKLQVCIGAITSQDILKLLFDCPSLLILEISISCEKHDEHPLSYYESLGLNLSRLEKDDVTTVLWIKRKEFWYWDNEATKLRSIELIFTHKLMIEN